MLSGYVSAHVSSPSPWITAPSGAGILVDDEILSVDGEAPRDVIRWRWVTDDASPVVEVRATAGLELTLDVERPPASRWASRSHSALFDQVRTVTTTASSASSIELPPGLRKSLYLKDDDYRLSFLYGNFTTLTRFTEADLERVVTEGLQPAQRQHPRHGSGPAWLGSLRNRRVHSSLRWLRALLDHGVEVHGQVVCCPAS